ncbi:MAG: hypothetical protein LBH81_02725 [Rickettsiales bacterium]|jgi:hypothetical protein|nr:hypothetical protein [Rickettsiales bacterium]
MTHDEIWAMIDLFAKTKNMSPFRLARLSGLDGTIFNPCRRVVKSKSGKTVMSWPKMETIARMLKATDTDFMEFAALYPKVKASAEPA